MVALMLAGTPSTAAKWRTRHEIGGGKDAWNGVTTE